MDSGGRVIRIDARVVDEVTAYTLGRGGERVLSTTDTQVALSWLHRMQVSDPRPLLKAAAQWGAVEIHGEAVIRIRRPASED